MLKELFGIVDDVVKIVKAPVDITLAAARAVTKHVADVAKMVGDGVKEALTPDDR